jgi:DNA replication protein DnaC
VHFNCALCEDVGMRVVDGEAKRCECWYIARRQAFFDLVVPKEFLSSRLATAVPDPSRHKGQSEALTTIRRNPFASYIFVGANGSGKSFLSWMLTINSFESGRRVVAIDLDSLLKQYRSYEFNDGENPAVLAYDLKPSPGRARASITIFIDEIAATNPTEYAGKEFFQLLKAAHEFEHQVLMTCNVSLDELHRYWARKGDPAVSNSIMRRITDYMTLIDFS